MADGIPSGDTDWDTRWDTIDLHDSLRLWVDDHSGDFTPAQYLLGTVHAITRPERVTCRFSDLLDRELLDQTIERFVDRIAGADAAQLHQEGGAEVTLQATLTDRLTIHVRVDNLLRGLLVFKLSRDGSFEEIYNGPGAPVWALVESKPKPSNGQYKIGLAQLRKLMLNVPPEQRLQRRA
ncbi:MAG: DUF6998 domain-containing protein [Pyrinomonadaceae bacterium]